MVSEFFEWLDGLTAAESIVFWIYLWLTWLIFKSMVRSLGKAWRDE